MADTARTTLAMVELFEATHPQLAALAATVAPTAVRHPDSLVPERLLADARAVLAATRRILSREIGYRGRLELHGRPAWAELDAKLRLAREGCRAFKARHFGYDHRADMPRWRTTRPRPARRGIEATDLSRQFAQVDAQLARLEAGLD